VGRYFACADLVRRPATDAKWDSDLLTFFAYQEHDRVFEELYCMVYRLLDTTFVRSRCGYMDFPAVYDRIQDRLRRLFDAKPPEPSSASSDFAGHARREPRPLSFDDLAALFGWIV